MKDKCGSSLRTGDYVETYNRHGDKTVVTIKQMGIMNGVRSAHVELRFSSGIGTVRAKNVRKLSDAEVMLWKLENL